MDDEKKLKKQLLDELIKTRKRLSVAERLLREHGKREEALRKSEERYRALVENTTDWIWETDTQHRCVYTNAQVKNILGYEPEEILGKPPSDFMTADELNRLQPVLDGLLSAPSIFYGLESQQLHKDGSVRYLEMNIIPIFNADRRLGGFRGVTRDITSRKKMEMALRDSEERFQLVVQAANDAIYDWNLATGTVWLSESHRELLGFPGKGGHVQWWQSRLHPSDRERILNNVQDLLNGLSSVWSNEYRFLGTDGRYIDVLDRGQIIRDEKGSPLRIVGSMMNITARKLAEEAFANSEENYRLLIEDSPIGIIVYAPDSSTIMSNSRARLLLDVTEDQILGRHAFHHAWAFLKPDGSRLKADEHPVNQAIAGKRPIHDRIYGISRPSSTEVRWYLVSAQPQWDKAGQLLRVILSLIDITLNIKMQKALIESEAKYRFLTEKMSDIVWTTDIDLRFTYISPSIRRSVAYSPDDLLGRKISDMLTPESFARSKDILEKELIRNETVPADPNRFATIDATFFHKEGSIVWFETVVSFIRDSTGKVTGLYGVSRNITDQKLAAAEKEKLIEELKQALSEVKTLGGLLPICSHCKKIRDDKGYWNQLEGYISQHSDAMFSHSICPDCAVKLYPDFFRKNNLKTKD